MVFTIITYYNPVRRHLYGVYHHNLLPVRRHLYGVYHHNHYLLEGTSMVFTITTC